MEEQKTRDQIDIELSRTYFGNNGNKTQFSPQVPEKPPYEKAEQDKVQDTPYTARKRWSVLTVLMVLWVISSLIFAAGYFLRGKRIVFNVNINVEPDTTPKKETRPPKIIQDLTDLIERTSTGEKISVSLPGKINPSQTKINVAPPGTINDLLSRIQGASSSGQIQGAFAKKVSPEKAPTETPQSAEAVPQRIPLKIGPQESKTLYDFELSEDGWEIPSWELDKPDHVARSLAITDSFSSKGSRGLELVAEFPGSQWTAALIEVQQYLDLRGYDSILVDIYLPAGCPEGLRTKLILTVGDDWRFVEMSRSVRLIPGEWTTISADVSEGSGDWKRTVVDDFFKEDIRKIAVRIESNRKPAYSGPIYIDNLRLVAHEEKQEPEAPLSRSPGL
jgi:hypothetical protein